MARALLMRWTFTRTGPMGGASTSLQSFALPRSLALCLGACACGVVGRVIADARAAQPSPLLGLSPFELLVIFIAARAILRGGDAGTPPLLLWPAAILLLAPSGAGAFAVLTVFALAQAARSAGEARTGYLLFAALGVSEIWVTIGFKLASPVLLPLDAQAAAVLLRGVGFTTDVSSNVVHVEGGNAIVVLIACATLHRLPLALVAAAALAAPAPAREMIRILALAAAGYMVLNMARLVAMGWSPEAYAFMHDGTGASLYDAAQTALVFLVAHRSRP